MTTQLLRSLFMASILLMLDPASAQLSGTYTIGGTNPDYGTLTEAVNDLQNEGVSGPVTFNVRNGTYNEFVDFHSVPGASATNFITFQSETGISSQVIFENESDGFNSNFDFDGAAHYVMKGITFNNTNANDYWEVVGIHGDCENLTFENCRFITANTVDDYLFYGDFEYLKDLTISNCYFGTSYQAIYLYGSDSSVNVTIEHNQIDEAEYGIEIEDVNSVTIFNNNMPDIIEEGISVEDIRGDIVINNNYLNLSNPASNGDGIIVEYTYPGIGSLSIQNNHIIGNGDYEGLEVYDINLSGQSRGIIANNMVSGFDYGLVVEYLANFLIAHNSFYAFGENYHAVEAYDNTDMTFKNNIIGHETTETDEAIDMSDPGDLGISDYNIFFVVNNDISSFGETLADHQNSTGGDANSQNINPEYWDGPAGDLRICNSALYQQGEGLTAIGSDIFDENRHSSNPTPGAMELLYPYTEARADFSIQRNGLEVTFINETENQADFVWDFGDGNTSTAKNPTHTYAQANSYEVTLQANSECGSDQSILVFDVWATGINKQVLNKAITVLPNPTKGMLKLEVKNPADIASIQLFNTVGEQVYSGGFQTSLDISHLPAGIYIMEVQSRSGKAAVRKIMKE